MAFNFKRNELLATPTRSILYGPVPAGVVDIVFSGTFTNIDDTNKSAHTITLEVLNSANTYVSILYKVPVPFGGSSKCPKINLLPNEYLYVTSDATNVIQCCVNILEKA